MEGRRTRAAAAFNCRCDALTGRIANPHGGPVPVPAATDGRRRGR
jgi:hypothetical protein